ncbi:MAG: threonine/serine dehydratase [Gemmatimonadetes bacterium]|nr:threonine/serine dehydratase [Gemmatimonadota bacterium]MBT8403141.1 threonine/serine dehydratase [Gemmatimonadota bacterium]
MTVEAGALVTLDDVRAAADRIRGLVVRTPLLPSPELAEACGAAEVRLKCENLQRAGAFKARGGIHYVSQLADAAVERGVITYSSGNHAQAVALAARLRGVRAVVVMPTTAPAVKVEGARRLGAEVVFEGTTSLERMRRAEAIAEAEGLEIIPPFDHADIIAGQGTVGLEIVEDWPEVDAFLAPIGGGGLASGVAVAGRALRPEARIYGVEPVEGASMQAALEAGGPVTLDATRSIADGLLPVRAGTLTWQHLDALADGVVTVDDDAIRDATRFLLHRHRLVVEFSGAATVAALRSGAIDVRGRRVAVVLSGGNLDPSFLADLA